jgi:hypothetical protein
MRTLFPKGWKGTPSGQPKTNHREAVSALPRARVKPEGNNDPQYAFCTAYTPKNLVKPPNHLTQSKQTTSKWHISFTQSAKLDIEIKTAPAKTGAFSFKPINLTERII